MAKKTKIEHSEFSGEFEDDGITVLVDIHRPAGTQQDWTLEVISEHDDVTTWDEPFATDKDAWRNSWQLAKKMGFAAFWTAKTRRFINACFRVTGPGGLGFKSLVLPISLSSIPFMFERIHGLNP